jgi:hypothetical protein
MASLPPTPSRTGEPRLIQKRREFELTRSFSAALLGGKLLTLMRSSSEPLIHRLTFYTFLRHSDLPTASITTLTASPPFKGTQDEALAVSFIAVLILTNQLMMFPAQGNQRTGNDELKMPN